MQQDVALFQAVDQPVAPASMLLDLPFSAPAGYSLKLSKAVSAFVTVAGGIEVKLYT
jgi:hypothetical protein